MLKSTLREDINPIVKYYKIKIGMGVASQTYRLYY